MKLSDFNEYLQTVAALGAIVALLVVGYEIRESNRIATQQALSSNWSNWIEQSMGDIESGVSRTLAKSRLRPGELTLAEKIDLDFYLTGYLYAWHHDYYVLLWDTEVALSEDILTDLEEDAPLYFDTAFSRAWLQENKSWIDPQLFKAIERGLSGVALGSAVEYYRRIDALAATME